MSTAPVNLPDNRVFGGRYRLVRPLSEGGMGSVWEAEHLALKSTVVVKLIAGQVITAEARQRFLQEARTAAALASPHIVQIFDYGVQDGTPYIAMELLHGESLAQRLSRQGALSPLETEGLVRQVCRAAARAHEANVVHRDLKPGNIFLVASEDELLVKLLDFGIAKATNGAGAQQHTLPGAFLGTPTYASPEQAIGEKSLDHRSDLWSIGVITFECLLGRPPFVGDSVASVVLSVCAGPLPVPSECGSVPAGFDAWFRQACARDPEQRFQNARAMAEALRTVLNPAASAATTVFSSMPAAGEPAAALPAADAPAEGASNPAGNPSARTLVPGRGKSRISGWVALGAWVLVVGLWFALNGLPGSKQTASAPASPPSPSSATPPENASPVPRESEPNPGELANEEAFEPCRGADGPGCDTQCAGKNASRCFRVGAMYREGKNVAQDKQHAAVLFEAACSARSAAACLALGHMYLKGDGVSADPKRAMHLFEDACARGSADGCVELGRLLRPK